MESAHSEEKAVGEEDASLCLSLSEMARVGGIIRQDEASTVVV